MTTLKLNLPVGNPTPTPVPVEIEIEGVKYKLDNDGNAITEKGEVFKTKDEVAKFKADLLTQQTTEEEKKRKELEAKLIKDAPIELDGVTYTINDKGEAIDKDGKVVKTKDELLTLLATVDENEEVNYLDEIQKQTNLVIAKEGKPITYENTLPGMIQYVKDVHQEGIALGTRVTTDNLINSYPVLRDVLTHLKLHNGSLEGFQQTFDWRTIKLDKTNVEQCKDIYIQEQLARGIPKTQAEAIAKYLVDDKKISDYAEQSLAYLIKSNDDVRTAKEQAIKAAEKAVEEEDAKYWRTVTDVLKSKKLNINGETITLPDVVRVKDGEGKLITRTIEDFKKYITIKRNFTINNKTYVMTELEYDEAMEEINNTPHHDLFNAFRRFVKYDDSQLIKQKVSTETAKHVIKLTTKEGQRQTTTTQGKLVLPVK